MGSAVGTVENRCLARVLASRNCVGNFELRSVIDPAVAAVFRVDAQDLGISTRGSPRAALARQVAMYLAHVVCGLSMTEVGALFARDRTTVAHACTVVEDMRDDPDLDGRLDHLERAVVALLDALFSRRG